MRGPGLAAIFIGGPADGKRISTTGDRISIPRQDPDDPSGIGYSTYRRCRVEVAPIESDGTAPLVHREEAMIDERLLGYPEHGTEDERVARPPRETRSQDGGSAHSPCASDEAARALGARAARRIDEWILAGCPPEFGHSRRAALVSRGELAYALATLACRESHRGDPLEREMDADLDAVFSRLQRGEDARGER